MKTFSYPAGRIVLCMLVLFSSYRTSAQLTAKGLTAANGTFIGFYEYKPADYTTSPSAKYPVIIFLHGIGERGNGTSDLAKVKKNAIPKMIDKGHKMRFYWNGKWETFLVLAPQLSSGYGSWQRFYVEEMIKYASTNLNIDTNRIMLTGLSLGGGGVWSFASASLANASKLAAIAPICGTCSMSKPEHIAKANLPVWAFHASNDGTVSVNCTHNAVNNINSFKPAVTPIKTIYPDGNHAIWGRSYDSTYKWHEPNLYEWFLGQNKSLPVNKLPIANAGQNVTISAGNAKAVLDASKSTDADGTIVRYIWKKLSGPAQGNITNKYAFKINLDDLNTEGVYTYELTVVDNRASIGRDTVSITVVPDVAPINKLPVAKAGASLTITLPQNSVTLDGSASADPDGWISSYSWSKIQGPSSFTIVSPNSAFTAITNLSEGSYLFELEVSDNAGGTAVDTVRVTVNPAIVIPNKLPKAIAGENVVIQLPVDYVTLDGSSSYDPDGNIVAFKWQKILGPAGASIEAHQNAETDVSNLREGLYSFELTVTDNDGAKTADTILVTVLAAPVIPNKPPIADAGEDIVIQLPVNVAQLDGTKSYDPDGELTIFSWRQSAGPSTAIFDDAQSGETEIKNLLEGTYTFILEVTDGDGESDADTVFVNVLPAPIIPNKPPVADAGADRTIQLPTDSIQLDGRGSIDEDGTIVSYAWTQINGPATSTLRQGNSATTIAANLVAGIYSYQLLIKDDRDAVDTDTVYITVMPAPVIPNKPPVALAGEDQTIQLPLDSVQLDGSSSFDEDGHVSVYSWSKISGPDGLVINTTNSSSIVVSQLKEGVYQFRLSVTDDDGASDFDTVFVTVLPEPVVPNKPPVAHAGGDKTIQLPVDSTLLDGSSSYDEDGTINAYAWTRISGPAGGTIKQSQHPSTMVTNLMEGTYSYELMVIDDDGSVSSDTVLISVLPAPIVPNKPPVAKAGENRTIRLPINSVLLNGSGSTDEDGRIRSYSWRKVSGPAEINILHANKASTNVSELVEGIYEIELSVTDDQGAIDADTVRITVLAAPPVPNKKPVANAGDDRVIQLPIDHAQLDGRSSTDEDGTITSYSWTKISGPAGSTIHPSDSVVATVGNLKEGAYTISLTVTDDDGATDSDTLKITVLPVPVVPNKPPVARAGNDRVIQLPMDSVLLDGAASSDEDGTIRSYTWTKFSGPAGSTIHQRSETSAMVFGLKEGIHLMELTVTDEDGDSASDTLKITVMPAPIVPNKKPVARAGNDRTIQLPVDSLRLDGSASTDEDGTISTYLWTKISGPAGTLIQHSNRASTWVTGLTAGRFSFRLLVTDNDGASSADTISIEVLPAPVAPNKPPVAEAGADRTIRLPVNSVVLDGSASKDPDGTITSYHWSMISGPAVATIQAPSSVNTVVNNLKEGIYTFRLLVTDNQGLSSTDSFRITVLAALVPPNKLPVANAGADFTITLPLNTTRLDGSLSNDPDGKLVAVQWTQVAGPAAANITEPGKLVTEVKALQQGFYVFRLSVTDDRGASASDSVKITVIRPANMLPVAAAGANRVVYLPVTMLNLNGSGSYDPDGQITAYSWNRISGPGAATIIHPNTATPSVVGLQEGLHVFRLTVTDDKGASASDEVSISVEKKKVVPPVIHAGGDTTLVIPANSTLLYGTVLSEGSGTITANNWRQISGPATALFVETGLAMVQVKGLAAGTYEFEWSVETNDKAIAKDTAKVIVVDNFRYEENFDLWPNPAGPKISLRIMSDSTGVVEGTVFSFNGRAVMRFRGEKQSSLYQQHIDVSTLPRGFYVIEVAIGPDKKMIKKFIRR